MKKIGLFAAGVLFGTAGMKLLGSKDAKRAYAQTGALYLGKVTVCKNAVSIKPPRYGY